MDQPRQSNDPLHGVTLKQMLIELSGRFGWKELAALIRPLLRSQR